MPPKTRRAGNGPTTAGQSTLSFKNRISKPLDSVTALKHAKSTLNEPAQEIIISEIVRQSTPEPAEKPQTSSGKGKIQQAESPVRIVLSPTRKRKVRRSLNDDDIDATYESAVKEALKASDSLIKKYWKAEEDSRKSPRIHQNGVHLHEKILRHFDLSSEYGPCIGMTRLSRWKRAHSMALSPPIEVLAVLLKEDAKKDKRIAGRIAYADELAGTKDFEVAI